MKRVRIGLLIAGGLLVLAGGGVMIVARLVGPQHTLGVNAGRLAPCPATPNCVSSFSTEAQHALPPIAYSGTREAAHERLRTILRTLGGNLMTVEPDYLHAVFRSRVFGFPDDLEFYLPADQSVIHFRAGARMGRSDLGVNRARMQRITAAMAEEPPD